MSPDQINILAAFALVLLTVSVLLLAVSFLGIFQQAQRTMIAYEKLADTLNSEVPATMHEFKLLAQRVNSISNVTSAQVEHIGQKVEEVSGSIETASHQAKKHSQVLGSALLAGVKAYLTGD